MTAMPVHGFVADDETPVFVISVAAELAEMHPQTLRQYDRLGLVTPSRTQGGGRRYSTRDIARLREVLRLSQEGVSLAGIQRITELENQVDALRDRIEELTSALQRAEAAAGRRVFAVGSAGETIMIRPGERPPHLGSQALVRWDPFAARTRTTRR